MISKQVMFDLPQVDEQTDIAYLNGVYIQVAAGDVFGSFMSPAAVAQVYVDKGIRIPETYGEARNCVAERIMKLQNLL